MNKKLVVGLSVILGVIFVVFAVIYLTTPAQSLPAFLPGHTPGLMKIHRTHGAGSLFVGLLFFAFAWFQSGKKKQESIRLVRQAQSLRQAQDKSRIKNQGEKEE